MPLEFAVSALVTLLVVVDPVGLVPAFISMTEGLPTAARRQVAIRACLIALCILLGSALIGDWLLKHLGIGLPAFRIAGGLLLFWIASDMVFGWRVEREARTAEQAVHEHVRNIAAFPLASTWQVRGNKIMIVPAYAPTPQLGNDNRIPEQILEQTYGPPVHLGVRERPLAEVLDQIRDQTGANIVLGVKDTATEPVTLVLHDVRLRTALTILADMAGLRLVKFGNVYYITTPENAERMQAEADRDLFGEKK